jgi:hypothetical protein
MSFVGFPGVYYMVSLSETPFQPDGYVQLASIVPHTLLSNLEVFTNLHVNIVFAVLRKDTGNIKDRTE